MFTSKFSLWFRVCINYGTNVINFYHMHTNKNNFSKFMLYFLFFTYIKTKKTTININSWHNLYKNHKIYILSSFHEINTKYSLLLLKHHMVALCSYHRLCCTKRSKTPSKFLLCLSIHAFIVHYVIVEEQLENGKVNKFNQGTLPNGEA